MEEGTAQPEQPEPGEAAANAEEASALVGAAGPEKSCDNARMLPSIPTSPSIVPQTTDA